MRLKKMRCLTIQTLNNPKTKNLRVMVKQILLKRKNLQKPQQKKTTQAGGNWWHRCWSWFQFYQVVIWERTCHSRKDFHRSKWASPYAKPLNSQPFDYFCLFSPIFFYPCFATHTNTKAEAESKKKDGHVCDWQPTTAAVVKRWHDA
jgi:hypothetical protein